MSKPEKWSEGVVSVWHSDDGWGVFDSPATPGGCWAHFSHLEGIEGFRELADGEAVRFTWERVPQDGYDYRAVLVERVASEDIGA